MTAISRLKDYLICMQQIPPLSSTDFSRALEGRTQADPLALRLLEEHFLPKVICWVMPYRGRGLELVDLIAIGNRALLRGLRQLKPGLSPDLEDALESAVVAEVEAVVLARQ